MSNTIDQVAEQRITLSEACRLLSWQPSPATLWRWRTKGVLVRGRRIKLRCEKVGRRWMTTKKWFMAFIQEQTEAATAQPQDDAAGGRAPETQRQLTQAGLI